jgi:hypothetical protein
MRIHPTRPQTRQNFVIVGQQAQLLRRFDLEVRQNVVGDPARARKMNWDFRQMEIFDPPSARNANLRVAKQRNVRCGVGLQRRDQNVVHLLRTQGDCGQSRYRLFVILPNHAAARAGVAGPETSGPGTSLCPILRTRTP